MSVPKLKLDPLLRNVLVPTDFCKCSQKALLQALAIAKYYKAAVTLLHVILSAHLSLKDKDSVRDAAWRDMRKLEADLIAGALPQDVPHRGLVEEGKIWPVICGVLKKYNIDLIVMGTHGRTGLEILLLGSFAETVFRRATCPVLTVGPKNPPATPNSALKNVLFATDFSDESEAAEPYAFSLASSRGATLSLLNVVKPSSLGWGHKLQTDQKHLSYAQARLRATASYAAGRRLGPIPNLIAEVGPVVDTIVKVAIRLKADLIVLGASAPRTLADRLGETPAYRVVCTAPCPVLTIREPSRMDYFERLFATMPKSKSAEGPPIRPSTANTSNVSFPFYANRYAA
jgi:nucleotide-binding universal stress UspA family protein